VSTGAPNEIKLYFSCSGPRIDVWAPGSWVTGPINTSSGIADSRNGSYYLAKKSGTSQASPQVAGVIACWAQDNPTGTQTQALSYVTTNATTGQLYEYSSALYGLSNDPNNKAYSLEGGANKTLYYTRAILPQSGGTSGLSITGVTMTGVTLG
jgi:subtilisin family serine protease